MIAPKRKYIIGFFILLMVSAIVIVDISMLHEQSEAELTEDSKSEVTPIHSERDMFTSAVEQEYASLPADKGHERKLLNYYNNRAYSGAPPVIPHKILNENTMGGKSCLQCHAKGGFAAVFNAFTPVTPHPELINCKQCHVPRKSNTLFIENEFVKLCLAELGTTALEGSPPVIPHTLQLRENCMACHAGPAAPKEIRVSHPERIHCRQCHARPNTTITWERLSQQPDIKE
jgi:cytochrome c-type protein NapB